MSKYVLPKLLYAYNALEPYISEQIMTLHHSKHHQLYVNNLNAAVISQASADLVSSIQGFKDAFTTVLLGIKGSGWGWLLTTSKDQDIVPAGKKPLLGIDMWEHAYYLQYLNDKKEYVNGIWNIINWSVVEKRFGAIWES
ncbi:hypothetical protein L207DRAFT_550731 [Hyaloscypha variabilis F]|uniref:Superoxide dismutase n=1 Tax=Hyaloscypha variabilis (strain UAMH 11265 / GT02V1 / F) TaxID=1149755 RepID=A0A2J6SDX9_HYAVF|nr:hypothetical protein L207DRAFT_550731 [Hyaloscypha variabilis F]